MNKKIRNITLILLFLVVLGSFVTSLYTLRNNNLRMKQLRTAVIEADEEGDNAKLEEALDALREQVIYHMNTDLRLDSDTKSGEKPIQLPYKHYRDTLNENYDRSVGCETVSQPEISWYREIDCARLSRKILNDARKVCETEDFVISERLSCLLIEVNENPDNAQAGYPEPTIPSKDFYVYDFASPKWSPDLAGYSLAVFFATLAILVLRLLF